ncbi:MAG: NTP transferase domain-containing protein, partial [Actinomyces sp.]|nr:NTP transferase domain-containing protein [Actinomyces sp.]
MTRIPVRPWALVLAAGQGKRLSAATGGHSKQFLLWQGVPLYWHSARTLARSGAVAGLVFVFPQDCLEEEKRRLAQLARDEDPGIPWLAVAGGAER